MNLYARLEHATPGTRHTATWNAVAAGSHFAADPNAGVEERERMLAEAASIRDVSRARRGGDEDPACSVTQSRSPLRLSADLAVTLAAAWRLIQPRGHSADAARWSLPTIARMWR